MQALDLKESLHPFDGWLVSTSTAFDHRGIRGNGRRPKLRARSMTAVKGELSRMLHLFNLVPTGWIGRVNGHLELPVDGLRFCPLVASRIAQFARLAGSWESVHLGTPVASPHVVEGRRSSAVLAGFCAA
jgi:hypothetical protein